MSAKQVILTVLGVGLSFGSFAASRTNWVSAAVAPGAGSGTEADPYGDLNFAISNLAVRTSTSDVVILKKGVYRLDRYLSDSYKAIIYDQAIAGGSERNYPIEIRGETGDPADVVIDGCGQYRFLTSRRSFGRPYVYNLTVQNCLTTVGYQGAITQDSFNNGSPIPDSVVSVISNCVFRNCHATANEASGALHMRQARVVDCYFDTCTTSNATGVAEGAAIYAPYNGAMVENCAFRNCHVWSNLASSRCRGGAVYVNGANGVVSNCWFDACSAVFEAKPANGSGGAVYLSDHRAYNCYVTNCWTSGTSGGIHGWASGSTVVDCRAATSAAGTNGGRNNLYCNNTATGNQTCNEGSYYGCVFRGNKGAANAVLYMRTPNKTTTVVSNCVFAGNATTGTAAGSGRSIVCIDGWQAGSFLFVDTLFRDNSVRDWGTFTAAFTFNNADYGLTMRNCLFRDQYQSGSAALAFINSSTVNFSSFENCSFIRTRNDNQMLVNQSGTAYQRLCFRNSLFVNTAANKMIPTQLATLANVTNCVFTNGSGVNLDPEYGNRVMTLQEMDLDGSYRPRKGSPLVDVALPTAWEPARATRLKGPWDMGDGTWKEAPYATISLFGRTYPVGVVITRGQANPRLVGSALDIGSGEYCRKPGGMTLLFR